MPGNCQATPNDSTLMGVHPWLKERIRAAMVNLRGIRITSGKRSHSRQRELHSCCASGTPVPGVQRVIEAPCSQHEYGFAVDVRFDPVVETRPSPFPGSGGRPPGGLPGGLNQLAFERALTQLGVVVSPGHYTVFPEAQFTRHIRSFGWPCRTCVGPRPGGAGSRQPIRLVPSNLPFSF